MPTPLLPVHAAFSTLALVLSGALLTPWCWRSASLIAAVLLTHALLRWCVATPRIWPIYACSAALWLIAAYLLWRSGDPRWLVIGSAGSLLLHWHLMRLLEWRRVERTCQRLAAPGTD